MKAYHSNRFHAFVTAFFLLLNYVATSNIEKCDLLIKYIDEFYGIGIYAGKEFATGVYKIDADINRSFLTTINNIISKNHLFMNYM